MPPRHHRTVDRITAILEAVAVRPAGATLSQLAAELGAPKSTVQGFVNGLLATGYLTEAEHRYFLGPGPYVLTLRAAQIPAGAIRHGDLVELAERTGFSVLLAVRLGDHVVYVDEVGDAPEVRFIAKSRVRRPLLGTAAGQIMLADMPEREMHDFLRNCTEHDAVSAFLQQLPEIRRTGIARNLHSPIAGGSAIATRIEDRDGALAGAVSIVGAAEAIQPRFDALAVALTDARGRWGAATNDAVVAAESVHQVEGVRS